MGTLIVNNARKYRQNRLPWSEDFTLWRTLTAGTGSVPIITGNQYEAPDGSLTADRVILNKGAGTTTEDSSRIMRYTSSVPGTRIWHSLWARTVDNTTVTVYIEFSGISFIKFTVTPNWSRIANNIVPNDTTRYFTFGLRANVSEYADLALWGAQVNFGDKLLPYAKTTGSIIN